MNKSSANTYGEAVSFVSIIEKLIKSKFDEIAEEKGVLVRKVAIVKSYDSTTNKAIVYFPESSQFESTPYINKTGVSLSTGDKVYIFHQYGKPAQGWIILKA